MQKKIYNTINPSFTWSNIYRVGILLFLLGASTWLKANTFVVTTSSSNGEGSFMQALQRANAHKGLDKIVFSIRVHSDNLQGNTNFHYIHLGTTTVSDDLIIDGQVTLDSEYSLSTIHYPLSIILNTEGGISALKNITFRGIGFVKNNLLTIQSGANFVFQNCVFSVGIPSDINNPATLSPYNLTIPVTEDSHFKNCSLEVGDNADPSFKCGSLGNIVKNFNFITNLSGLNINNFIQKTAKTVLNNKNIVTKGMLKLRRDTVFENNSKKILYRIASKTDTIPVGNGSGGENCGSASNVLSVIVSEKTLIVANPNDITECVGGNQQLTIAIVGGTGNITYTWQVSTNGIDFKDAGAGLTFTPPTATAGTFYYRAVISSDIEGCGHITSSTATVAVVADPTITVKASKSLVCAGETASLTASISGGTGAPTYQWQQSTDGTNWTDVSGANTAVLNVANLLVTTNYRVKVTQASGCASLSNFETITIGGCRGVIGDFAWLDCNKNGIQDAGETGLGQVPIVLKGTTLTGEIVNETQTTLINGQFQFKDVKPGKYRLIFGTPGGNKGLTFTQKAQGNKTIDSDPDANGKSDEFTFGANEVLNDIDGGYKDIVVPTVTAPTDKEVACDGLGNEAELKDWLLNHAGATATDNISTNLIWTHNFTGIIKTCGGSGEAKVTFTVTDECGNATNVTATFKIKDTTPPAFSNVPQDLKLKCGDPVPAMRTPSVSDLCDVAPKVVSAEKREDLCGSSYKLIRTWTATDACGNTATATQTVSFEDNEPPVLLNIPNAVNLTCTDPIPTGVGIKAKDNCDDKPQVTMSDLIERGTCGANYKINRIWTAADVCGNIGKGTQVITIGDYEAPSISGVPADITVSCGSLIGLPVKTVKAVDKCSGAVTLKVADKRINGICTDQYTVARTWTAIDACGNVAFKTQKITVKDDILPELIGVPTDLVVNQYLGQTVPAKANVVGTDNCDSRVDVTYKEVKTNTLCGYQLKRTWVGMDNCNNRIEKMQTITVNFSENLAKILSIKVETCNDKNGRVELSPSTATYTYKWSDGKIGYLRTDLPAGTYNVTATSGPNCAKVIEINVKRECDCDRPIVSVDKLDITCAKVTEGGTAVINIANGLPAEFKFTWSPSISTTNIGKNLAAGSYIVRVERLNKPSCFNEINFTIKGVEVLALAEPKVDPAGCKSPVGKITFTVPVGDVLKFKWSNNDTLPVRSGLAAGIYTVTITRPNSSVCPLEKKVEVKSDNLMSSDYVINRAPSCGLPNGSATITTIGGSGNYTYSWGEGNSRFVLPAGPTTVTVTDNVTGCFNIISFVLISITPQASVKMDTAVYTTCQGMTDGRVTYNLTLSDNFVKPAKVVISDLAGGMLYANGALAAGDYVLMVKDAIGCVAAERKFKVLDPAAITPVVTKTNQTCDLLGTISLTTTGGNGSYKYAWSDLIGQLDQPAYRENLKAGFYSITISDIAGCQRLLRNIQVKDSCACRPALVDSVSTVAANCGQSNGKALIILLHGSSYAKGGDETNYSYSWTPLQGISNTTGNGRSDLAAGIYDVTIAAKINLTCITKIKVAIGTLEGPTGSKAVTAPATCDAANGSANLSSDANETLTYYWVFDGKTAASRNDLKAGSYQVLVSNPLKADCKTALTVKVESQSNLSAIAVVKQKPTCGQATGTVAIRVAGGSGQYTYSGAPDSVKTGLKSGIYAVTVTDIVSNCKTVVTFSLSDDNGSTATVSIANPNIYLNCAGNRNGYVSFKVAYDAGFAHPAQVSITDAKGRIFGNDSLPAGSYCIFVKDAQGCLAGTACFDVREPVRLNASVAKINKTCDLGGRITFTNVSGGTAPYKYVWSDNTTLANSVDRTNLQAGSYSVTVYDAKGCSFTIDTIQIKNECPTQNACNTFTASASLMNKSCLEGGKITLKINGGTLPYSFDWLDLEGTINPQNRLGLEASTYNVVISDAAGCKTTLDNMALINTCVSPNCIPPVLGDIIVSDATCGQSNGQISVAVLRPTAVVFKWLPNAGVSNSIKNLAAGVYKVNVCTAGDATCFIEKEIIVKNQNGIAVGQPTIIAASCSASNGKVEFPSLGRPLDYAWSDGKNGGVRADLPRGSYSVTVTDPTGQWCKQVVSIEVPVTNGLIGVAIVDKKADCKQANGQATIRLIGGSGSFSFSWGATAMRNDLKAGVYNVIVTDNQTGCQANVTVTMTENVSAFAMVNISQPIIYLSCAGANDGAVIYTVNYATGFASPERIVIADNLGHVGKNDSLSVGRYGIFVYNKEGCLAGMGNFEVREPQLITINAAIQAQTCLSKGNIALTVKGGSGIYKYKWGDLSTANSRADLTAGDYSVTITDSKGCSKIVKFTVPNEALNCNGQCTLTAQGAAQGKTCTEGGKIQLFITNGSGRYGFLWSDLNGVAAQPQDRTNLNAGTYSVVIIDSTTNCKFTLPTILVENKAIGCNPTPCKITANAEFSNKTCMDGGIIKISNMTGTAPHKFDWLDLPGTDNPQNRFSLLAGSYTVVITDALGCKDTMALAIKDNCTSNCTIPVIANMTVTDATCFEKNGAITLTMSDAAGYNFQWTPNVSTTNTATGLTADVYKIKISRAVDALCFIEKDIVVNNKNDNLVLGAPTISSATCGASNGSITINGRDTWKYVWSDGKTGKTRPFMAAGTYIVTVTDPSVSGCPVMQEVVVKAISSVSATVRIDKKPTCGASNGQATILVTGGSGNYNFSWGTAATRSNLKAGSYNVTVFDNQSGCSAVVSVALSEDIAAGATVNIPNPKLTLNCRADQNGKIDYTVTYATGFVIPALVKIVDEFGNLMDNGRLKAGKYKILVTDANGCMAGMAAFDVIEPDMMMAQASVRASDCNVLGTIALTVSGGGSGYIYDWADVAGVDNPRDRSALSAGIYSVFIKDARGCTFALKNIVVGNLCTAIKPKRDTIFKSLLVNRIDTFCMPLDAALIGQNLTYAFCDGSLTKGVATIGTNGCITYKAGNTPIREEFCVKACNGFNVCDTTTVFINVIADPSSCLTAYLGSSAVSVIRCDTSATICTNIPYKQMNNYTVTDNSANALFFTEGCKKDTIFTYAYFTLTKFYPNGPWDLDSWAVNNKVFKARIPTIKSLVDSMNRWDANGNWALDSTTNNIVGGDNSRVYGNMLWKRNGRNVATFQVNKQLVPAVLSMRLPVGEHKVVFIDKLKGCKDSTNISVVCNVTPLRPGSYTIDTVLFVGKRDNYCLNNGAWASQTTIRNVCVGSYKGYASYSIDDNTDCVRVIGVSLGRDTLCLKRCYSSGVCDTVKMIISVKPLISASDTACIKPYTGLSYFNVPCGTKAQMCTNLQGTDTLNYAITINGMLFKNGYYACSADTTYAYTYFSLILTSPTGPWKLDGWNVNGKTYSGIIPNIKSLVDSMNRWDAGGNWRLESTSYAIKGGQTGNNYGNMIWYRNGTSTKIAAFGPNRQFNVRQIGLLLDPGRHKIIFKNVLRGCSDTANIVVECRQLRTRPSMTVKDTTIYINTTGKYCLPTNGLLATSTKLTPICNVKGYISYISDDATDCVVLTGATIGRDTICLQRCDFDGECDTVKLAVNVIKKPAITTETVFNSLKIGRDSSYCVKLDELKGTRFTLRNICENNTTNNVNFVINGTCVKYTAINMGVDTACLVLCDDLGSCDTTKLLVYVINERQAVPAPIAVNDRATTAKATKVNITPIVNDTVFGLPSALVMLSKPAHGSIFYDEETKIVTYQPEGIECVGTDTFSYALVTMGGRDTAFIKVEVMCDEVVVFSGFSPNEDGVNDNFTILGLEKYPNNKLFVFNRNGNQAYSADNYKNDWNALTDGVQIPDGTYFYVLDLGNGKKLSGYVQIHR